MDEREKGKMQRNKEKEEEEGKKTKVGKWNKLKEKGKTRKGNKEK